MLSERRNHYEHTYQTVAERAISAKSNGSNYCQSNYTPLNATKRQLPNGINSSLSKRNGISHQVGRNARQKCTVIDQATTSLLPLLLSSFLSAVNIEEISAFRSQHADECIYRSNQPLSPILWSNINGNQENRFAKQIDCRFSGNNKIGFCQPNRFLLAHQNDQVIRSDTIHGKMTEILDGSGGSGNKSSIDTEIYALQNELSDVTLAGGTLSLRCQPRRRQQFLNAEHPWVNCIFNESLLFTLPKHQ